MKMVSDDDLNLKEMTDEELAAAWNLWFSLAQTTNDADPPYTHGVFVNVKGEDAPSALACLPTAPSAVVSPRRAMR